MLDTFAFRMLRQNRRLQEGSDAFHGTLEDIGAGVYSDQVRQFLIEAYKRGAEMTQDNVGFEDSTACFTKRRYRDRWNKCVLVRLGRNMSACLKSRPSPLRAALTAPLCATQLLKPSDGRYALSLWCRYVWQASGSTIHL